MGRYQSPATSPHCESASNKRVRTQTRSQHKLPKHTNYDHTLSSSSSAEYKHTLMAKKVERAGGKKEGPERTQATALRLPDLGGRDARVSSRPHGEGPRAVSGRRKALAHRSHEGAGRRVGPRQRRAEKNIRKSSERGEKRI